MRVSVRALPVQRLPDTDEVLLALHPADRQTLGLRPGDLVYVRDPGWWHGGLRSVHGRLTDEDGPQAGVLEFPAELARAGGFRDGRVVEVLPEV